MATYTVKIDGVAKVTGQSQNGVTGYPCAMYPNSSRGANTTWYSAFYCWMFDIGGTAYYQYGALSGALGYSGCAAQTKLTTPSMGGYTTFYRTGAGVSALANQIGSSHNISSGTIYDAGGGSHTLSIEAVADVKKYSLTFQVAHNDGTTATSSAPTVKVNGSTKSYSSSSTSGGVRSYVYRNIEEGSSVSVKHPSAASNYVLAGFMINSGSRSYSSSGHSFEITSDTSVVATYNRLHTISLAVGAGGGSISASSTTSYTGSTSSATATSSTKSIKVEDGQSFSISAQAADGYVLVSNAVVPSSSAYGSLTGNGSVSVSGTQYGVGDVTFTVRGAQYYITPSILNTDSRYDTSTWGTAVINGVSGSVVLKPNTTYYLGFTPTNASKNTHAPVVDHWSIGGGNYTGSFTTGSTVTSNLNAYLTIKPTQYQLIVENITNSNWGTLKIQQSGVSEDQWTNTGWFPPDERLNIWFFRNSDYDSTSAPVINQCVYNGKEVTSTENIITLTTVAESLTASVQLRATKFAIKAQLDEDDDSSWGTISYKLNSSSTWTTNGWIYVGSGDKVDLRFTPNASLVNTIHPQLEYWTLPTQNVVPEHNADGSSTVTVELGAVTNSFRIIAHYASMWRKVSIQRSDSGSAAWGNFYLGNSGTDTTVYYPPGTEIKMRFVRDANFDMKERPQVNTILIGANESWIPGQDEVYEYAYTLPEGVKTDLVISCALKQTAWPVSVTSGGNGSVTARRMDIASGSVLESVTTSGTAKSIYLRFGATAEYVALISDADDHYQFESWTQSNLTQYGTESASFQLSTAANATVSGTFSRDDFCITCTSDNASVSEAYMQESSLSSAYYKKNITVNPVVVCKIKSAYAGQYRVASFTVGSQTNIEPQYNAMADLYYVEVVNRTDVTVTAHIVPTYFNLTVNVGPDNKSDFGRVLITADGQEISENGFNGRLREGTEISIVFYGNYGGRVLEIQPSSVIAQPVQTESSISFEMPSADCSVSFTLGAKETYQLTVGVVNLAEGEAVNIPGIVKVASRTYPNVVIGATADDGVAKTFTVYKDEEYSLSVESVNEFLARRYTFVGWRDSSGQIEGESDSVLNILNETESSIIRYAAYNARGNGTITIEYAKKVGDTITAIDPSETMYQLRIDNTEDMYDETHWLIGSDVNIGYTAFGSAYDYEGDAYKWTPVQVDVAIATDEYRSPNAIWDDGLLTQIGSFKMLGNMKVRLVLTQTYVPGYTKMHVGLRQSTTLMGEVSIFSTEMDAYTTDSTGATALVQKTKKAVIMAAPRPGYAFAGWWTLNEGVWSEVEDAKAVFEVGYVTSPMTTYYAQFVASTVSNLKEWNGDTSVSKMCEWRSKVYVGSQFFRLSCCRAYADAYPVTLEVFMSSSPDGIFSDRARSSRVVLRDQNARRMPMIRPEKYFAFKVTGYARINHVAIASSMEALK